MEELSDEKQKQISPAEAKAWWGKLNEDDLKRAGGKFEVFTGSLQEKYGYTRQQASDDIDKRVTEYESNMEMKSKTQPTAAVKRAK